MAVLSAELARRNAVESPKDTKITHHLWEVLLQQLFLAHRAEEGYQGALVLMKRTMLKMVWMLQLWLGQTKKRRRSRAPGAGGAPADLDERLRRLEALGAAVLEQNRQLAEQNRQLAAREPGARASAPGCEPAA